MLTPEINNRYQVPSNFCQEIFRTYDIRGEVSETSLTPDLAYSIGLAIGSEALARDRRDIIVGRDGRLSGPELKLALVYGLLNTGCNVVDIGIVPTPLVYFATNRLWTDSGVMVTASHNPANHNGFKIVLAGETLSQQGITALYQRIQQGNFVSASASGQVKNYEIISEYIHYVLQHIKLARQMHVAIDCGNGAASKLATQLYRNLGCKVSDIYCELDGRFPNHHPDPTIPENLQSLIELVKNNKADIGIAFDGDADRLGIVTNKGEIIWPDQLMMLFAQDLLSRHPGSDIIFDVKCSKNLATVIEQNQGNPIMYRTGHSLLKNKMMEMGALLAGEMSGHIFFKEDWFGFDDGMYAGAKLLQILSNTSLSSSELFKSFPQSVNTPELKLPLAEERKSAFMQRLLDEANFGSANRITIDGLRVEFDHGWGLIRPSNTSPYLILRFEADNAEDLQKIKEIFRRELLRLDSQLQLPF